MTDVNLVLDSVHHSYPDGVDLLLVGPQGQNAIVTSDAGGSLDVADADLTLDDEAAAPIPDATQINTGADQPANYTPADTGPPRRLLRVAAEPSRSSTALTRTGFGACTSATTRPLTAAISGAGTWLSPRVLHRHHLRHRRHRHRHLRPLRRPLSRAEPDRPAAGNGQGTDPGTALPSRHRAQGSLEARRPCRGPEPTRWLGTAGRLQGQPEGGPALTNHGYRKGKGASWRPFLNVEPLARSRR